MLRSLTAGWMMSPLRLMTQVLTNFVIPGILPCSSKLKTADCCVDHESETHKSTHHLPLANDNCMDAQAVMNFWVRALIAVGFPAGAATESLPRSWQHCFRPAVCRSQEV